LLNEEEGRWRMSLIYIANAIKGQTRAKK